LRLLLLRDRWRLLLRLLLLRDRCFFDLAGDFRILRDLIFIAIFIYINKINEYYWK